MKTRGWLAGIVLLLAAGCGTPWEEYSSADGRFKVVMPGVPKESSFNQDTPQGVITFNAAVVDRPHASFLVAWADVPPKLPFDLDKALDTLRAHYSLSDKEKAVVKEKHPVEKAGQPGLAFVMDTRKPAGQAVGRLYQVQNRLYQLLVLGSKVEGSSEAERFFETFRLINPLMKPETTAHD